MALTSRCCARLARSTTPSSLRPAFSVLPARRWATTTAAVAGSADPKISGIVDQISRLTLMETADLVSLLKTRLNIPDVALQTFSAGPAGAAAPAAAAEEETAAEPVQEKTMFNVRLMSLEPGSKPKVIKEVKSLLGLSLVDSKKFVESVPKMLKEGLVKEEAEKIQKVLKDLGAVAALE